MLNFLQSFLTHFFEDISREGACFSTWTNQLWDHLGGSSGSLEDFLGSKEVGLCVVMIGSAEYEAARGIKSRYCVYMLFDIRFAKVMGLHLGIDYFYVKFTYTQNFSANLTLMRIQKETAKSVPFFCRPLLNHNCWIFIRLTPEGVEGCILASNEAVHAAGILAFGWLLHCTLHTTTNRSLWNNSLVTFGTDSRKVMGKFGDFTFKFCCMAWMVWTIHT